MILKVYDTVILTTRVSPTLAKILVTFPSTATNLPILLKVSMAFSPRDHHHPRMSFRMTWWGAPPPGARHANLLV
jgi:hypothetical protein